jgi:hypothetical protein
VISVTLTPRTGFGESVDVILAGDLFLPAILN